MYICSFSSFGDCNSPAIVPCGLPFASSDASGNLLCWGRRDLGDTRTVSCQACAGVCVWVGITGVWMLGEGEGESEGRWQLDWDGGGP